tara:strand:+ start:4851 stop:5108 length:258 start_codon:yes stop_codon:yes gene_type:complete
MADGTRVDGLQGVLYLAGLGEPWVRGVVAGSLVGVVAAATGLPKSRFDEEGKMRPWKVISSDPEAVYVHFLAIPVGAALIGYLFT